MSSRADRVVEVTSDVVARFAPPRPPGDADKAGRGQVLIVGGSAETAGAVQLAGIAALRVGAGKLQLATAASAGAALMAAVPEARVIRLPESEDGAIDAAAAADPLVHAAECADAVLIGTGTIDPLAAAALLDRVVPLVRTAIVILDANAIPPLADLPPWLSEVAGRLIVMPNPGELRALGFDESSAAAVCRLAGDLQGVVAARGADSFIADANSESPVYRDRRGHVALATSGSGDVAAGIIAGLAARGASPLAAAITGVHLHGRAGERVAVRVGGIGALARDLLEELPALISTLP